MRIRVHYGRFKLDYDFYWITKKKMKSTVLYSLALTLLGLAALTFTGMLSSKLSVPERIDWLWVLYYVFISVPLQEIIFRGIIFTEIARRTDVYLAMILSSSLYAAAFVTQVPLVIFAFFAGLMWNYMLYEKPNIIGPIISHAVLGLYLFLFII